MAELHDKTADKADKVTEGNKLIAEFMNEKIHNSKDVILLDEDHSQFGFHGGVCGLYSHNNRMYHNSWDWLMPVVIKCAEKYPSDNIGSILYMWDVEITFRNIVIFLKAEISKYGQYR